MVLTESIELRLETHESDWVSAECVVCGDAVCLNPRTWLTPASDYREVCVDGRDTGFVVCEDCYQGPLDALIDEVERWVDDVIRRPL